MCVCVCVCVCVSACVCECVCVCVCVLLKELLSTFMKCIASYSTMQRKSILAKLKPDAKISLSLYH